MMDINLKLDTDSDNYTTLRDALAMAAGAQLVLQPGVFPLNWVAGRPALRIPAGCVVSAENVTLSCTSSNPDLFAMLMIEADDVTVRGLGLVGDRRAQAWYTPGYWCLMAVRQARRVRLERVRLERSQKFGLDACDVSDLTLTRCRVTLNGYAEKPAGNDPLPLCGGMRLTATAQPNQHVTLAGCVMQGNGGQGANLNRVDGLTVSASRFESNGSYPAHGNQDGLALSGITGGLVRNCVVDGNLADGIVLTAESQAQECRGVTLRANRARRNGGNGILLYEHDTPDGGRLTDMLLHSNVCGDNGQMTRAGYPWGFSGIRLGARGFGRISDIRLVRNSCYDSREGDERTQMCGIDMLPREIQPFGGLGPGIRLEGNQAYNHTYQDINLWQLPMLS